jgi:hypothetical protein
MKASVKLGSRCQAVPINQIVPDARRVAAPRKLQQNRLAVHFAGTCCALEIRPLWPVLAVYDPNHLAHAGPLQLTANTRRPSRGGHPSPALSVAAMVSLRAD